MEASPLKQAIRNGLRDALERDPSVVVLGEGVGYGDPLTDGLQEEFGDWRVLDAPHAPGAIVGAATGLALAGMRPVARIDRPLEAAAAIAAASEARAPVLLISTTGFEAPSGLAVMAPSNGRDARALVDAALLGDAPVLLLADPRCSATGQELADDPGPIGARVVRAGDDVTVVTWGVGVGHALAAAERCDASCEVIDLRTLLPLDLACITTSLARTGKVVVLGGGSHGGRIASAIAEAAFTTLDAAPAIVDASDAESVLAAIDHLHQT